jgi:hypothetical protein
VLTEEERLYGWFQQDSATAHIARMSLLALSSVFGDRIISSDIWPARSPDLNLCDFFLWGCLKDKVYNNNPRKEEELKESICREISNICCRESSQGKSKPLPLVRGISTCKGTAFSTPPMICEQK